MLLYRIETSLSRTKFVPGVGLLSEQAYQALLQSEDPFQIPAEFPDPKTAPIGHIIHRHLKGDHIATPYISLTPYFDRALLFAIWRDMQEPRCQFNETVLYIIDSDRLTGPILEATSFFRDFDSAATFANKKSYNKVYGAITNTDEYLARRAIPARAIISSHSFEAIRPHLPPWFFQAEHIFAQPEESGSVRNWRAKVIDLRDKYVERVLTEPGLETCQEKCIGLARMLLNAPDTLEGDIDIHFLSLHLGDGPKIRPFVNWI